MLNMKYTRIFLSEHREVLSGSIIREDGVALVFTKEGDATKVCPSTGVANEIFAGVSLTRNIPPVFMPRVETFVIPSTLTGSLDRVPMSGQLLVKVNGTVKTVVAGAPANAGEVQLSGSTLVFAAGEASKTVAVQYIYEPTVMEARTYVGDAPVGGLGSTAMGIIGMITRGDICTNYYDPTVDWSSALTVKLGLDGKFTTTGVGAVVPGAVVLNAPGSSNPMLVLRLS